MSCDGHSRTGPDQEAAVLSHGAVGEKSCLSPGKQEQRKRCNGGGQTDSAMGQSSVHSSALRGAATLHKAVIAFQSAPYVYLNSPAGKVA